MSRVALVSGGARGIGRAVALALALGRAWVRIVNVSSDAARVGSAQEAVYAGAKAGVGRPDEVAAAVACLACEDAGYITGQTLSVSGGLTMA